MLFHSNSFFQNRKIHQYKNTKKRPLTSFATTLAAALAACICFSSSSSMAADSLSEQSITETISQDYTEAVRISESDTTKTQTEQSSDAVQEKQAETACAASKQEQSGTSVSDTTKTQMEQSSDTAQEKQTEMSYAALEQELTDTSDADATKPQTERSESSDTSLTEELSVISDTALTEKYSEDSDTDTASIQPEPAQDQNPSSAPAKIISILNMEELQHIPSVTIIQNFTQNDDALLALIQQLQSVEAIALLPNASQIQISLSVDWNTGVLDAPQIDVSVPGTYEECGRILAPDGYAFAEGVMQEIIIPVNVIIPDSPAVITSIDSFPAHADAYAFSLGTTVEEIRDSCELSQYLQCFDASGNLHIATICWDFGQIQTESAGLYEITGQILPPEHTVFAETLAVEELAVPVSIQESGKPEINCYYAGRGAFIFPWCASSASLDRITVWISEENGVWECYTRDSLLVYWDAYQLSLDSCLFEKDKNYRIQVDYDGGTTKILSFTYDSSLHIESYNEGDRDGGDANGFKPERPQTPVQTESEAFPQTDGMFPESEESDAESIQPPSSQSNTGYEPMTESALQDEASKRTDTGSPLHTGDVSSTQPDTGSSRQTDTSPQRQGESSVREDGTSERSIASPAQTELQDAENQTILSGERLLLMLDFSGFAQFSNQGISVLLSQAAIQSANPSKYDSFTIAISRPDETSFSFSLMKNETALTDLPNTKLILPWKPKSGSSVFLLLNKANAPVSLGQYDAFSGSLAFLTDHSGSYTILEIQKPYELLAALLSALSLFPALFA